VCCIFDVENALLKLLSNYRLLSWLSKSNCYAHVQTGVLHATVVPRQIGARGESTVESGSSMQVNVGGSHVTALQVIVQSAGTIVVMPGAPASP
jgi:hypothetical protein